MKRRKRKASQPRRHASRTKSRVERWLPLGALAVWAVLLVAAVMAYQRSSDESVAQTPTEATTTSAQSDAATNGTQRQASTPSPQRSSQSEPPLASVETLPPADSAPAEVPEVAGRQDTEATAPQAEPAEPPSDSSRETSQPSRASPDSATAAADAASSEPAPSDSQRAEAARASGEADSSQSRAQAMAEDDSGDGGGANDQAQTRIEPPQQGASDLAKLEPAAPGPTESPKVARARFTTGIDNREPVDRVRSVFHAHGKGLRTLYYFTEIKGMRGETVTHRWELDGKVMAEVKFPVGSNDWRIYSSKRLVPSMKGRWRVVVSDSDGQPLMSSRFRYVE